LIASDFGGREITLQADTNQHSFPEIGWYEDGHPATDIAGMGSFEFAKDLELLKTDGNGRLLYALAGTNDYLYLAHVPADNIGKLDALLANSGSGRVGYPAGASLFDYPTSVAGDDKSTGPHIHAEMYRQKQDGTYGFADPTTGKYLPSYMFRNSIDGVKYVNWRLSLPGSATWRK
jgi:hypothetical protein